MEKTINKNSKKSFTACLEVQLDGLLSETDYNDHCGGFKNVHKLQFFLL